MGLRNRKHRFAIFCGLVFLVGLSGCTSEDKAILEADAFIAEQKVDKTKETWKTTLNKPPIFTLDAQRKYFWELQTNKGNMTIQLMPAVAPMHVSSTIYLTRLGFYDNTVFHRVIKNFMAQGGDPTGTGRGNPGYRYDGEFDVNVKHDRAGLLSMANAGPGTDGSQFFITFRDTPHLNGNHTIFGEVVQGMDTLKTIESLGGGRSGRTTEKLEIVKATIRVE
ncbi:peptidylprolyl isomerase [Pleionea sp. CnH1-48]|uniref:peptidylprolyl isomerase n=1 Tax=Pleionea sp. CnH1-48 TaxID=2954494 RepID=UPI0021120BD3|nr:peptidylprolyl isomerase [Pleionea sp. CnH1-48]